MRSSFVGESGWIGIESDGVADGRVGVWTSDDDDTGGEEVEICGELMVEFEEKRKDDEERSSG
jgi:hypothetical protein